MTRRRKTVFTQYPDTPPPQVLCPQRDSPLVYRGTVLGGIVPERYDRFSCPTHAAFEYRHRTRTLRQATDRTAEVEAKHPCELSFADGVAILASNGRSWRASFESLQFRQPARKSPLSNTATAGN